MVPELRGCGQGKPRPLLASRKEPSGGALAVVRRFCVAKPRRAV